MPIDFDKQHQSDVLFSPSDVLLVSTTRIAYCELQPHATCLVPFPLVNLMHGVVGAAAGRDHRVGSQGNVGGESRTGNQFVCCVLQQGERATGS